MKTKEIEEAKQNIFGSVDTLRNYPEEDIIHDFGSMERFLEILTDEIKKLVLGIPKEFFAKGLDSEIKSAVEAAFGSWEKWVSEVKAAAASTPGWVLVTWNSVEKKIDTFIVFEHHIGLPSSNEIILALDCWEHAYMIDYGTNKADYVKAFLDNVDWDVVGKRFKNLN